MDGRRPGQRDCMPSRAAGGGGEVQAVCLTAGPLREGCGWVGRGGRRGLRVDPS